MIVGEILRVVPEFTAPAASVGNMVFHYELQGEGATDEDVLSAMEDFYDNEIGPAWAAIGAQSAELTRILLDIVNEDGTVNRNIGQATIGLSGSNSSQVLPAADSALVSAPTQYPKIRGRKYIPYMGTPNLDNGAWTATMLGLMASFLAEYVDEVSAGGTAVLVPGVRSTSREEFVPFLGSGSLRGLPKTQRRRQQNVGS